MARLITINRPLQEVFGYLTDHSNDKYWKPFVTESIKLTPDPIGIGTRFKITTTAWGYRRSGEVEILEYEPFHSFAYRVSDPIYPFTARITFSETPIGTQFSGQVEFHTKGFWKLLVPLFLMFIRIQEKQTFNQLKQILEHTG